MIKNILDRKGSEVFTILPSETLRSAAASMREHNVSALMVVDGQAPKGIITERDIVQAISRQGAQALVMGVGTAMSRALITVTSRDTLRHAMRLMTVHRVRHLPVVDDGRLVGLVSIGDVVKLRLEDLETETNVLRDAYIAHR